MNALPEQIGCQIAEYANACRLNVSDPNVWHDRCPHGEQMQKLAPPHQWIRPFPGG